MKITRNIVAFISAVILTANNIAPLTNLAVEIPNIDITVCETDVTSNYGKSVVGWKDWTIGNSEYSELKLNSGEDTVSFSSKGSSVLAAIKLINQAKMLGNYDFTISIFVKWINDNNYYNNGNIVDWNAALSFVPDGNSTSGTAVLSKVLSYGKDYKTEEDLMKLLIDYRKDGKGVIAKIDLYSYVLCGNLTQDEKDIEVIKTKSTDRTKFSEYKASDIKELYVFDCSNRIESFSDKDDNPLNDKDKEIQERSNKAYRISNYTQTQKEHLALIKNKYMTQKDISIFKWNMILSQFTIPYVNTIKDVANSKQWTSLQSNLNSIEFSNEDIDSDFIDNINSYINYLKSNSSNFVDVLEVLKGDSYYTTVFTEDNKIATVSDMLYGNVLYLKDNYAVNLESSTDTTEEGIETDVTEVLSPDIMLEETASSLNASYGNTEDTTDITSTLVNNITAINNTTYFVKLNEYYNLLNKDKEAIYDEILRNSNVIEIALPCYVNTDSTFMYNTVFLTNAMKYSNEDTNDKSLAKFIEKFVDKPLILDMYGNLCIEDSGRYIVVYPSYANPLYSSDSLDDEDVVGIVYDDYANQITQRYQVQIDGSNKILTAVDNSAITITNKQALNKIVSPVVDNDTAIGMYGTTDKGSFQVTDIKSPNGVASKDLWIPRINYNNTDRRLNLLSAFIDNTTLYIGSLTLLSMITDKESNSPKEWYDNLKYPTFNYTANNITIDNDDIAPEDTNKPINDSSFSGDATLERILPEVFYECIGASNSYDLKGVGMSDGKLFVSNANDSTIISEDGSIHTPFSTPRYAYAGNMVYFSVNNKIPGVVLDGTHNVTYPFIPIFDNHKGIFSNGGSLSQYAILNGNMPNSISDVCKSRSKITSEEDHNSTGIYNMENLWLSTFIDASKFYTYLTLNTNIPTMTNKKNNALPNSAVWNYTGEIAKRANDSRTGNDIPYVSLPINLYTIDDASGWNKKEDNIQIVRGGILDSEYKGLIKAVYKNTDNEIDKVNGTKYVMRNQYIKNDLVSYTVDDILFIAALWDGYYINKSPIVRKFDAKSITTGELYTDKDTVLTPYNILSDNNVNRLYYTRITNNSMNIDIKDIIVNNYVSESSIRATTEVYNCIYNQPLLMISVYKNGYEDNLERWVSELKDDGSEARYMMDLISQVVKYPITGTSNLITGLCQYLHSNLSNSSVGTFLNFSLFSNLILYSDIFKWYLIIQGIVVSLSIVIFLIMNMFSDDKKIIVNCSKILALGFIPVFMLYSTSNLFNITSKVLLSDLTTNVVVTGMEYNQNKIPKELYGSDDDILIDDLYFKENSKPYIEVLADKNGNKIPVELEELYSLTQLSGISELKVFSERTSEYWYSPDRFVPVNYERYGDSIFFYFYDWYMYQYLSYCTSKNLSDYSLYSSNEQSTDSGNNHDIKSQMESQFMKSRGNFSKMYNDDSYVLCYNATEVKDICGLSNLFDITSIYCDSNRLLSDIINDFIELEEYYGSANLDSNNIMRNSFVHLTQGNMFELYYSNAFKMDKGSNTHMSNLVFSSSNIPKETGRVTDRVYASYGLLKEHTGNKSSRLSNFETRLYKVNKRTYKDISKLCNKYDDDIISDNILIYMTALNATFEFNREFANDNAFTGICTSSISTDMLFKSMFSKDYKQIVSDDNIVFVVYKEYGLINAILLTLSEVVLILSSLIMSVIHLGLFVSCMISTFYINDMIVTKTLLNILKYTGLLFLFEVCMLLSIRLLNGLLLTVHTSASVSISIIIFLLLGISIFIWSFKLLIRFFKNLKQFGGDAVSEVLDDFKKVLFVSNIKTTVSDIADKANRLLSNYTTKKSNDKFDNNVVRRNIQEARRKKNIEESEDGE